MIKALVADMVVAFSAVGTAIAGQGMIPERVHDFSTETASELGVLRQDR